MKKKIDQEVIRKAVRKYVEKNTPLPGGKCHCGGDLVKRAREYCMNGCYAGEFYYGLPHCKTCGRVYRYCDEKIDTEGEEEIMKVLEEFIKILNEPITL